MSTTYYPHRVELSQGQAEKLKKAYESNSAITLRLSKNELTGPNELMLTKTQINKINKATNSGTGVDVKISKTQIRKAIQKGGGLWSSLFSLGAKALPYATKAVSKVAPYLATGALSTLGSLGIDTIFGKGIDVPFPFLPQMINLRNELTKEQLGKLMKGMQSGKGIIFKPTKKQINGGFLGHLSQLVFPWQLNWLLNFSEKDYK